MLERAREAMNLRFKVPLTLVLPRFVLKLSENWLSSKRLKIILKIAPRLPPEEEEQEEFTTGGGVDLESYTREARFLTRWDQHAVAQRQP